MQERYAFPEPHDDKVVLRHHVGGLAATPEHICERSLKRFALSVKDILENLRAIVSALALGPGYCMSEISLPQVRREKRFLRRAVAGKEDRRPCPVACRREQAPIGVSGTARSPDIVRKDVLKWPIVRAAVSFLRDARRSSIKLRKDRGAICRITCGQKSGARRFAGAPSQEYLRNVPAMKTVQCGKERENQVECPAPRVTFPQTPFRSDSCLPGHVCLR